MILIGQEKKQPYKQRHYLITLLQIGHVGTSFYASQEEEKAQGSDSIVHRHIKLRLISWCFCFVRAIGSHVRNATESAWADHDYPRVVTENY